MPNVPATGNSSSTSGMDPAQQQAFDQMQQAFDKAITASAQITAMTTEKKVELDAAKQRPQN